jgi:hypothetical protein
MEYMEAQMQTAMEAAEMQYRQDALRRQLVDTAVNQAMRHFEHIDSEVDRRDLHYAAVTAAIAALHLSIESDTALKTLTVERDRYKKLAEDGFAITPPRMWVPAQGMETRQGEDANAASGKA